MARIPWSEDEIRAFLGQQFDAQHRFYLASFPAASFDLIERAGEAIGRLYVDPRPQEIRVIDVALLPAQRGRGLGTRILQALMTEADRARLPLTLHVEPDNPAVRLYRRLGFEAISTSGLHQLMRWMPASQAVGLD